MHVIQIKVEIFIKDIQLGKIQPDSKGGGTVDLVLDDIETFL